MESGGWWPYRGLPGLPGMVTAEEEDGRVRAEGVGRMGHGDEDLAGTFWEPVTGF